MLLQFTWEIGTQQWFCCCYEYACLFPIRHHAISGN